MAPASGTVVSINNDEKDLVRDRMIFSQWREIIFIYD